MPILSYPSEKGKHKAPGKENFTIENTPHAAAGALGRQPEHTNTRFLKALP
jgi:hypothetical protein